MLWPEILKFLISAAVVVFAGTRLTKYADVLSDKFNLSKAWIGVLMLGLITSLPELATSLAAIVTVKAPDLAIGNMFGSNNINLMIIVMLDVLCKQNSVTNKIRADASHIFSAVFTMALSLIAVADILISRRFNLPVFANASVGTILIALTYFLSVRFLFQHQKKENLIRKEYLYVSDKKIFLNVAVSVILIFVAAKWVVQSAESLAGTTGLGRTFVGSVFLAFVTSLPEIVVSVSAFRLGSLDMAFGNIFGSNMINIFIVFICDLFYNSGAVLAGVSGVNIFVVLLSIILTSIVIIGVKNNKKPMLGYLSWDTLSMLLVFIAGMRILYIIR